MDPGQEHKAELELGERALVLVDHMLNRVVLVHRLKKLTSGDRGWMTSAEKREALKLVKDLSMGALVEAQELQAFAERMGDL